MLEGRLTVSPAYVLAVLLLCAHCLTQLTPGRYAATLQPEIENFISHQGVAGLAIGIVKDDHLVYANGFGLKTLDRKGDPVTPESLFHVASITKTFVATSVMQLVEQGKVDLDATVVGYLPCFRMADDRYKQITIRHLLTHTSGIPDVVDYEWDKPQYDPGALERYVRSLSRLDLLFPPGTQFEYSNNGYEVLGDLIAKVSGEPFEDYVQRHILTPLRMTKSTLLLEQADPKLMTNGHILNAAGEPSVSKVFPYNRAHTPSSNLESNVLDMVRWSIANLNGGELDGKRILQRSTLETMFRPAFKSSDRVTGIGWVLGEYHGHSTVSYSGGDTGFASNLVLIPDLKIAVIVLSNCNYISIRPLTNAALDVALGLKPGPIDVKRSISYQLYSATQEFGIETAIAQYHALKKNHPDRYDFGEQELHDLGHYLIKRGKPKEAIRIFQLNAEIYPSSSIAYTGLGDGYLAIGDTVSAIVNFRKAIHLDPTNSHARDELKSLAPDIH
jgi:CubicO group peptidase (beta-lactamase class C family)